MAKLTNNSPQQQTKTITYYIDATNVCYWRNPETPSLAVLLKLLVVIKREKKQDFFCIFDANTAHKLPQDEIDIYNYMLNNGNFHQVSGGKRADDYLLSLADMYNGCVISNDNYSDPKYSRYRWKERDHRPTRLFMGEVIKTSDGEHLMLFDLDINVKLNQSVFELFKQLDTLLNPPKEYYSGTVKFYNAQRGWGRIHFLKETYIPFTKPANAATTIEEGMSVSFKVSETEKGEFAEELTFTPPAPNFYKGIVASYDEIRESGFLALENGPQRLFFRKSYFEGDLETVKITVNMPIECVIGSNSKGDCARQIKPLVPVAQQQTAATYEQKIATLEEKLASYKELLLSADKKLKEQALEIKGLQDKNNRETESLKKLHREEIDVLKSKFKSELHGLQNRKQKSDSPPPQEAIKQPETQKEKQQTKLPEPVITPQEIEAPALQAKKIQLSKNKSKELESTEELIKQEPPIVVSPDITVNDKTDKKLPEKETITAETKHGKKKNQKEKQKTDKTIAALENAFKQATKQLETKAPEKETIASATKTTPKKKESPLPKQTPATTAKSPIAKNEKNTKKGIISEENNPQKELLPALPEEFDTPEKILNWWSKLEMNWQKAFNVLMGNKETTQKPTDEILANFLRLTHLDLANVNGKRFTFKLNNLSGVKNFYHLKSLNISGHQLKNLNGTQKLLKLEILNCSSNQLDTLSGIANLVNLHTLNCANNLLKGGNLKGIKTKLPNLQRLDCSGNSLTPADDKLFDGLKLTELRYK